VSDENRDLITDTEPKPATRADTGRSRRVRLWLNWVLALLTVPGAAIVLIFALGAVMSTAGCSDRACPNLGPSGIGWGVLFYGAPVVALLAIVVSFFTASRRWGVVVPLGGWALLIADILILAITVRQ
jgi:hypothetical protein